MTVKAICELRVADLATWRQSRAISGCGVTNASLHAGRTVMEAWGSEYRSCLTWIKPRFGLGSYLRNQTEHLLFGVRGRAPVLFRGQGTWFYAPPGRTSNYSRGVGSLAGKCGATRWIATSCCDFRNSMLWIASLEAIAYRSVLWN